jgi:hypothetical protein
MTDEKNAPKKDEEELTDEELEDVAGAGRPISPGGGHGRPISPGGGHGRPISPGGGHGRPISPGGGHGQDEGSDA